jgi:hypothetical protein
MRLHNEVAESDRLDRLGFVLTLRRDGAIRSEESQRGKPEVHATRADSSSLWSFVRHCGAGQGDFPLRVF